MIYSVNRETLKARFYRASEQQIEAMATMQSLGAMLEAQAYLDRLWPDTAQGTKRFQYGQPRLGLVA
jgi:hypothetical protein